MRSRPSPSRALLSRSRVLRVALGLIGAAALYASVSLAPKAMVHMGTFRVSEVRFEGERFSVSEELEKLLGLTDLSSIWDDLTVYEARLEAHPLVERAHVRRRLMGTLAIEVIEPVPVALIANPTLVPVDGAGRVLPIDPVEHRLDLPVIHVIGESHRGQAPLTGGLKVVANELGRYRELMPDFADRISEAGLMSGGDLRVKLLSPAVEFYLPRQVGAERIWAGILVWEHASAPNGSGLPAAVDLRFDEQVIVRTTGMVEE